MGHRVSIFLHRIHSKSMLTLYNTTDLFRRVWLFSSASLLSQCRTSFMGLNSIKRTNNNPHIIRNTAIPTTTAHIATAKYSVFRFLRLRIADQIGWVISICFYLVWFVGVRQIIRGLCSFYVQHTYYAYVHVAPVDSDTTVHGETI